MDDVETYMVVLNHEEQYSIWPQSEKLPRGWRSNGKVGSREECLEHIGAVWTDMRPLSLRKWMAQLPTPASEPEAARASEAFANHENSQAVDLVARLSSCEQPVEVVLEGDSVSAGFKKQLALGVVKLKFTDTRGGTQLSVPLDPKLCDFCEANSDEANGRIRIGGTLALDYFAVRCLAEVELRTLRGLGKLEIVQDYNG